jgi:hypothetical protein
MASWTITDVTKLAVKTLSATRDGCSGGMIRNDLDGGAASIPCGLGAGSPFIPSRRQGQNLYRYSSSSSSRKDNRYDWLTRLDPVIDKRMFELQRMPFFDHENVFLFNLPSVCTGDILRAASAGPSPCPTIAAHLAATSMVAARVCRPAPVLLGWYACGPDQCANAPGSVACVTLIKESTEDSLAKFVRTSSLVQRVYTDDLPMQERVSMVFQLLFASACFERYANVYIGSCDPDNIGFSQTEDEYQDYILPPANDEERPMAFRVRTFGKVWFWRDLNSAIVGTQRDSAKRIHANPNDTVTRYQKSAASGDRGTGAYKERRILEASMAIGTRSSTINDKEAKDLGVSREKGNATFKYSAYDLLWGTFGLTDPSADRRRSNTTMAGWWGILAKSGDFFDIMRQADWEQTQGAVKVQNVISRIETPNEEAWDATKPAIAFNPEQLVGVIATDRMEEQGTVIAQGFYGMLLASERKWNGRDWWMSKSDYYKSVYVTRCTALLILFAAKSWDKIGSADRLAIQKALAPYVISNAAPTSAVRDDDRGLLRHVLMSISNRSDPVARMDDMSRELSREYNNPTTDRILDLASGHTLSFLRSGVLRVHRRTKYRYESGRVIGQDVGGALCILENGASE